VNFDRRHFLAAGLSLPSLSAALAEESKEADWPPAEHFPIWPSAPPGQPKIPPVPHAEMIGSDVSTGLKISGVARPELNVFRPKRANGVALLILPGGSYARVFVQIGGYGIPRLNALGYTLFVLTYRLPGEGWLRRSDTPLQDAQRAMRVIRSRAAEFSFDPTRIGVLAFSAGGHLAASLTTGYDEVVYEAVDTADKHSARPMFSGMLYPVIDMQPPFAHKDSRDNLLGPNPSPNLVAARSPQRHVTSATPPCFLAHALDDTTVAADNSVLMLTALREQRISAELHLFELGGHAFGFKQPDGSSADHYWQDLFQDWLARHSI
jgi:acetyl esterase/lipase